MYDIEILLHINRIFKDYNLEKEVINLIKLYIFSNRLTKNIVDHVENCYIKKRIMYFNSKELYISKRLTRNINKLPYDIIFILNYDGDKNIIKELGKQGRMNSLMLNSEKNEYYELILKQINDFKWTEIHSYYGGSLRLIY